jgi:HSP20 family molecular chaperone IbpA
MSEKKEVAKKEATSIESSRSRQLPTFAPLVDIYENDDEILLHADMPGVAKEDIRVNIDNGTLAISGVRSLQTSGTASWEEFGDLEYRRTFSVPQTIDVARVDAELKDGVLRLHLPKSEAAKPRVIEIHEA